MPLEKTSEQRGQTQFEDKWRTANDVPKGPEEWTVFVPPGAKPATQRQFSLFWYSDFIRQAIRGKGYSRGLELGCGRGTASLYLSKYDNIRMTLVDISPSAIELTRRNFSAAGEEGEFVCADAAALPLPDGSYDLVVMIGLLEHFADYQPILRECFRVLRPGGAVVTLNIPAKRSVQDLNRLWKTLLRLFTTVAPRPDYYRNADTPADYARAARESGFKEVAITFVNPFALFAPAPEWFDRLVARADNLVARLRLLWRPQPLVTGSRLAQAHFLVAEKPRS